MMRGSGKRKLRSRKSMAPLAPESIPVAAQSAPSLPESGPQLSAGAASGPSLVDDGSPDVEKTDVDADVEPEVVFQRATQRRRLALLTQGTVVVSALVCVLALGRVLAPRDAPKDTPRLAAASPVVVDAPAVSMAPTVVRPLPAPVAELASDHEKAKRERFEVQAALEIGDIRRAETVGQRAVTHDPTEADGWLLLVAAELELHHEELANQALKACAAQATHGPRGECVALMQPQYPR